MVSMKRVKVGPSKTFGYWEITAAVNQDIKVIPVLDKVEA